MSYTLNKEAALKAFPVSFRITEPGAYECTITQAVKMKSQGGAEGISFRFESGGFKDKFDLWTIGKDGNEIVGHSALMALMTCLEVREINESKAKVKTWKDGLEVEVDGEVFKDLHKKVGLLFDTEAYEYQSKNGDLVEGKRLVLVGVYQVGTNLVANEIMNRQTTPELLEKMKLRCKHRPLKDQKSPQKPESVKRPSGDSFEDDIPF